PLPLVNEDRSSSLSHNMSKVDKDPHIVGETPPDEQPNETTKYRETFNAHSRSYHVDNLQDQQFDIGSPSINLEGTGLREKDQREASRESNISRSPVSMSKIPHVVAISPNTRQQINNVDCVEGFEQTKQDPDVNYPTSKSTGKSSSRKWSNR